MRQIFSVITQNLQNLKNEIKQRFYQLVNNKINKILALAMIMKLKVNVWKFQLRRKLANTQIRVRSMHARVSVVAPTGLMLIVDRTARGSVRMKCSANENWQQPK